MKVIEGVRVVELASVGGTPAWAGKTTASSPRRQGE
jgi:hypothetical protein